MIESYYYAEVVGTGKLVNAYTARVVCQHPNGETLHYERHFPWYWLAKVVANRLAKSKAHTFQYYWRKDFKKQPQPNNPAPNGRTGVEGGDGE